MKRLLSAAFLLAMSSVLAPTGTASAQPLGRDLTWPETLVTGYSEDVPWALDTLTDDSGRHLVLFAELDPNLAVAAYRVGRVLPSGGMDTSFGTSGSTLFNPVAPDLFGGFFAGVDTAGRVFVNIPASDTSAQTVVLNASGALDTTFDGDGRAPGFTTVVNDDGSSWVANGGAAPTAAKRAANGSPAAGVLPNGPFRTEFNGSPDKVVTCVNEPAGGVCLRNDAPTGAADATFGAAGRRELPAQPGISTRYLVDGPGAKTPDGGVIVSVGDTDDGSGNLFGLYKFDAAGAAASGFGAGGLVATDSVFDVEVAADGAVYTLESSDGEDTLIRRYSASGVRDTAFGEVPTDAFELTASGDQVVAEEEQGPLVLDAGGIVQTLAGDWAVPYATLSTPGGLLVAGDPDVDFAIDVTRYLPLTPAFTALPAPQRLIDTRPGQTGVLEQAGGAIGADVAVPLTANVPVRLVIANQGGLPANPTGVAINATVAAPPAGGFLKIYPCADTGTPAPNTSTVNYRANLTAGNSAVVAQSGGGICMVASQTVNVIVDATGFFTAGFTALPSPQRLIDTRPGQTGVLEQAGGAIGADVAVPLTARVPVRLGVANQGGLPANPAGIAVNATVVVPPAGGFLKIYPCTSTATAAPATSSLNYTSGATTGNSAVVAQANGGICVVASQTVNVILDVTGYFTGGFSALPSPQRLIDTRSAELGVLEKAGGSIGFDVVVPLTANVPRRLEIANQAGLPTTAAGVAVNTTVVAPPGGGFVKIYPCTSTATPAPATSSLNYNPGVTTGNSAIVAPAGGSICLVASQTVNVIVDTTGFTA
jgi:hypothetical protein